MDKETLSQYGWIVIVVIVIGVMLVLAPELANLIGNGVNDTVDKFDGIADAYVDSVKVPEVEVTTDPA